MLTTGLPASPGAAQGQVVFSPDEAEEMARDGAKVVLVRLETSPDDFHGMVAAQAIVTARGGMTSHAAVVARGMGKTCVSGANASTSTIPSNSSRLITPSSRRVSGLLSTVLLAVCFLARFPRFNRRWKAISTN